MAGLEVGGGGAWQAGGGGAVGWEGAGLEDVNLTPIVREINSLSARAGQVSDLPGLIGGHHPHTQHEGHPANTRNKDTVHITSIRFALHITHVKDILHILNIKDTLHTPKVKDTQHILSIRIPRKSSN